METKVMENGPKKVEIIWVDSWSDDAILKPDVVNGIVPATRYNVGYLVKEDEEMVIIAPGLINNLYVGDRQMSGFWLIPKSMIKEIRMLVVVSEEKGCKQPEIQNDSTSPDSVTVGSDSMTWKT